MNRDAPTDAVALSPAWSRAPGIVGLSVLALAAWVFAGWIVRSPAMTKLLPFWLSMKVNTSVCLGLCGFSLYALRREGGRLKPAGKICSATTAALGLAVLLEWAAGVDLGIDQLLAEDFPGAPLTQAPGRMSVNAAAACAASGGALLLLDSDRRGFWLGLPFAAAAGFVALISLTAHVFGFTAVAALGAPTAIAQGTTGLLLLLVAGIAAARPGLAPVRLLRTGGAAGATFRMFLPLCVLFPVVVDALQFHAQRTGFAGEAEIVLGTVFIVALLCGILYWHCEREAHFEAEGREASRYNRSLIEASLDPLVTIDLDGKITDANAATEAIRGDARERLIGTTFSEYFTEPEKAREGYEKAFREGGVRDYPLSLRSRDGRVTPVLYNAAVYRDSAGRVAGVFAAARDVSELLRAEEALRRSARALRAISRCNEVMLRAQTERDLLDGVCRVIETDGGFPFVWVGYKVDDERKSISLEAESGRAGQGYVRTANITWADEPRGQGPTGRAIRTGKPQSCRDMLEDPATLPWRDLVRSRGFRASMSLPLVSEGRVLGALTLYSSEVGAFTDEETKLLTTLADDLSFGIMALRAAREVRKLNAELELRVAARTSELRQSEQKLQAIVAGNPDHLLVMDKDLRYTFVANPQLGLTAEEMLGRTDEEVLGRGEEVDRLTSVKRLVLERGETIPYSAALPSKNGSIQYFEGQYVPKLDPSGKVDGLIGYFRNVTERVIRQEELRVKSAQLAAANKELEAFAYSVSHDLRAPLRHIDGFIDLLEKRDSSGVDDESRRYFGIIRDAAGRMGRLIDDLLKFSRLGRAELVKAPVKLDALVEEVLSDLAAETNDRAIEWKKGPLPEVYGDPTLLRVVLQNLLGNAIKFTRGRKPAVIELGSRDEASETVVFVKDNGAGFDMAFADKLFGVFQRLHNQEEFEGTGIGLANVRRVVSRHGGRTWAEGKIGAGATFYFSLPKLMKEVRAGEPSEKHLVG